MNSEDGVFVLCSEPDSARQSVDALLSEGIPAKDVIVVSSVPPEHYGIRSHQRTLMPWLVVLGAVAGGIAGFLLTSLTQKSYVIHTGGMQVVTLWTDGIITYELTMLGAILTTGLVFLVTGIIRGRSQIPCEPEVSAGRVLVGVASVPAPLRTKITETLKAFGEIKPPETSPDLRA